MFRRAIVVISIVALTGFSNPFTNPLKDAFSEGNEDKGCNPQKVQQEATAEAKRTFWYRQIVARINCQKFYPETARAQPLLGRVKVEFTVNRAGQIVRSRIAESSGLPVLDEAAMAMLRRASLPPPPSEISGDTFVFLLPIRFEMKR